MYHLPILQTLTRRKKSLTHEQIHLAIGRDIKQASLRVCVLTERNVDNRIIKHYEIAGREVFGLAIFEGHEDHRIPSTQQAVTSCVGDSRIRVYFESDIIGGHRTGRIQSKGRKGELSLRNLEKTAIWKPNRCRLTLGRYGRNIAFGTD